MIVNRTCGRHPRLIWEVDRNLPGCGSNEFGEL